MDINKQKLAEKILNTVAYIEMDEDQMQLIVEYELEVYKPKVDELKKRYTDDRVAEHIHDWWLAYEIADETEDILMQYIND